MDFRGKSKVIINGREKSMLFYEDKLIWSKLYGEFAKDFKNLAEDESFEGKYNPQKGALMISSEYVRITPMYRYVRDSIMRDINGQSPHFRQVKVFDMQGKNIALNKPVTSVGPIWTGDVKTLVDGDPFDNFLDIDGRYLKEPASVTIDLQGQFEIKSIQIWHREGRRYPDAKVEVSADGKEWKTIFDAKVNGAYDETTEGKTHILG